MNILFSEHRDVLKVLDSFHVEYLLIGGYAVITHGYGRTTGDMDLWLKPDNQNRDKLCLALKKLELDTKSIVTMSQSDFTKPLVFSMGEAPQKIDFITHVNLVEFNKAYQNHIKTEIDGLILRVVNLDDLVLMKMNTGRIKDAADIEELQRIQKTKGDRN